MGILRAMSSLPDCVALPGAGLRVLVADDHLLVRDGLKLLLADMLAGARLFDAGDADSLERAAREHAPLALALVDLNMPGMERGQRLAHFAREHPALPLVVVSALTSPDVVRRTLEIASVHAFVPKSSPARLMREAIAAALAGRRAPFAHEGVPAAAAEVALTPRLEEVRALVRQGMSNKQIAQALGISEGTVKNHMSEMFRILNVSNRTQAARLDLERL